MMMNGKQNMQKQQQNQTRVIKPTQMSYRFPDHKYFKDEGTVNCDTVFKSKIDAFCIHVSARICKMYILSTAKICATQNL